MITVVVHEVGTAAAAVVVVAERIVSIVDNQVIGQGTVLLVVVVSFLGVAIGTVDVIDMGAGQDMVDATMEEVVTTVGKEAMIDTAVAIMAVIEAMTGMMMDTAGKVDMETAMEAGSAIAAVVDQQGMKGDTRTDQAHMTDPVDGLSMMAAIEIWQLKMVDGNFFERQLSQLCKCDDSHKRRLALFAGLSYSMKFGSQFS